jgi:PKD repeat protein
MYRKRSSLLPFIFMVFSAGGLLHAQPQAAFTVDVDSGAAPLAVRFSDQSTPQDSIIGWEWDLDGDGVTDSGERHPRWTYEVPGRFTITLIVRDSTSSDTARYIGFIDVAPVEESDIACKIRLVEYSAPLAKYIELWGYSGNGYPAPISPVSIRMPLDSSGCACFYRAKFLPVLSQNMTDVLVLDANYRVLGKAGFSYPFKDLAAGRRRDAVVFLHRDLTSYQDHPVEKSALPEWRFPSRVRFPWLPGTPIGAGGDTQDGPLSQTTVLLPPAAHDSGAAGHAQFRLANIRSDRIPLLLLPEMDRMREAWGADTDIITPADTLRTGFNGKRDYVFSSYGGRLQRFDHNHADRFDVWEYYYPPDQNWEESAFLFARDLDWLLGAYDTSQAAVAAHGVGGLVLRAYLEGTARNYTYFGDPATAIPYRGDVYKAVFLGTPHAGRLRSGLAYVAPDALPQPDLTDRHSPVLRELMPGRESLQRLDPLQLPAGVEVLNIAGSAPLAGGSLLPVESALHDDGRTAFSSATYPAPRTSNAVLGAYASHMLQSPDDEGGIGMRAPDAQLIPELLHAFFLSDTTLAPYRQRFLIYNPPDTLQFAQQEYLGAGIRPLRVDVGIPTLRLSADGVPFPLSNRIRLRLDLSAGNRLHIEPVEAFADLNDAGLHFYPTSVCFSDDPAVRQLALQDAVFTGVSRAGAAHPFRGGMLTLSGLGWQLPVQQQSIVPDPILSRTDDLGRAFDIARAAGDVLLAWSREKRSALSITAHEAMLLEPRRVLRGAAPDSGAIVDFTVDCLTDELSVLLDYGSGSVPQLALMAPGGAPVGASDANDTTVFFTHNAQLHCTFITIKNPSAGDWRLLVDNAPGLPPGCRLASVTGAAKNLQLTLSPSEPLSRQLVTVSLALDAAGPTPTGTSASCVIVDSTGNRDVILVADNGIAPDTAAGDGVYTGNVQLGRAGQYRIEGFYFATAGGCDIRRTAVRVLTLLPSLELLSPLGGEEWQSGTQQRIRWQGVAAQQVALDFSADGGASWTEIAGPLSTADGEFLWSVPGFTSTHCRIRIREIGGTLTDITPDDFTIYLQPELSLTAPNGGEAWQVATTQTVTWMSIAVDRVDISYSTNSGTQWLPVQSGVLALLGGIAWQVPVTPSDSCLLRIVSSTNPAVHDASDARFRITAIPALSLASPTGGERWRVGSAHAIRWQSAEIDSVRIELSVDDGVSWEYLATEASRMGEWIWTVPARISEYCLIRVTATDRPLLRDESASPFAITPEPFLQLLAPVGGEKWEIGSMQTIRWTSAEIDQVDIDYSLDNGQTWTAAAAGVAAATGSHLWSVPNEPSDFCRVRVTDTFDRTRLAVSPQTFQISESETRPTLFAPRNGAEGESTRPILRWLPFNGALTYQVQLTNDATLNTWVINESGIPVAHFDVPELARNTKYFWRVKAFRSGWASEWSTMWEFTTSGTTLPTPSAASPLDGAVGLATTINLWWNPAAGADAYHLQVASDQLFQTLVREETGITGTSAVVAGLQHEKDYWWRLRAGNTGSTAFSDWSRGWKFSTAPAPPRQLTPFDGLPDVPINALLTWYPVSGARAYRLQVASKADFSEIAFDSSGIVGTTVQLSGLWSYWTYYWRLNVTTSRGTSDWNAPWMFRTVDIGTGIEGAAQLPAGPAILDLWPQPSNGALSVALSFAKPADYQLHVFDMLGRQRYTAPPATADGAIVVRTLSLDGLDSGLYWLRLQTPDGAATRMIVIR